MHQKICLWKYRISSHLISLITYSHHKASSFLRTMLHSDSPEIGAVDIVAFENAQNGKTKNEKRK